MKSLALTLVVSIVIIPVIFITVITNPVITNQLPSRGDGQNIPTVRRQYLDMK